MEKHSQKIKIETSGQSSGKSKKQHSMRDVEWVKHGNALLLRKWGNCSGEMSSVQDDQETERVLVAGKGRGILHRLVRRLRRGA